MRKKMPGVALAIAVDCYTVGPQVSAAVCAAALLRDLSAVTMNTAHCCKLAPLLLTVD